MLRSARPLAVVLAAALAGACGSGGTLTPDGAAADGPAAADAPPPPIDAPPGVDAAPLPDAAPVPPGADCAHAIDLATAVLPFADSTAVATNSAAATCSSATSFSPEHYFFYDVGAVAVDLLVDVVVDEGASPPYDVVVSARTVCSDLTSEVACMDAGWGEHLEALGVTGKVSVLVDGSYLSGGMAGGDFSIDVRTRAIAGDGMPCDPAGVLSRCAADLRCDATSGTCAPTSPELTCAAALDLSADLADGAAAVSGTLLPFDADYFFGACAYDMAAGRPEHVVRFDVAAASALTASTDDPASTTFDTVLYLRADCTGTTDLACNDDVDPATMQYRSLLSVPVLAPGTYYLFVDTSSGWLYGPATTTPRDYHLTVTLSPL